MLDIKDIDKHFPFEEYREGQKECIEFILNSFNDGKQLVVVEGPTGSGKSAIGVTIANYFDQSYYLTTQKILQTQIVGDFAEHGMIDLQGRNAYPCTVWELKGNLMVETGAKTQKQVDAEIAKKPNCSAGFCRTHRVTNKCQLCFTTHNNGTLKDLPPGMQYSACPYYEQVGNAINAHITVMNFASFLYQTAYAGGRFPERPLLIIDECHNTEPELLNFVSLEISDRALRNHGITIPELDTPEEYAEFFVEHHLDDKIGRIIEMARDNSDYKLYDEYTSIQSKFQLFMNSITNPNQEWVSEYSRNHFASSVLIKPVFVKDFMQQHVLRFGKRVLMMSATILDVNILCDSLGINRNAVAARRMTNHFPVQNRPVYIQPRAKVVGGQDKKHIWGGAIVKAVDEIAKKYDGKRGIVHTHNFDIARMLVEKCKSKSRFLFQEDFENKAEMLRTHGRSNNTIIVAPAMHEGLDLIDDLSRFQILCKVPWPNFHTNKQLARRVEIDRRYYDWLTALKLVQSIGRSVRSKEDWADTYIIDEGFIRFYKQVESMLPTWFKDSLIFEDAKV